MSSGHGLIFFFSCCHLGLPLFLHSVQFHSVESLTSSFRLSLSSFIFFQFLLSSRDQRLKLSRSSSFVIFELLFELFSLLLLLFGEFPSFCEILLSLFCLGFRLFTCCYFPLFCNREFSFLIFNTLLFFQNILQLRLEACSLLFSSLDFSCRLRKCFLTLSPQNCIPLLLGFSRYLFLLLSDGLLGCFPSLFLGFSLSLFLFESFSFFLKDFSLLSFNFSLSFSLNCCQSLLFFLLNPLFFGFYLQLFGLFLCLKLVDTSLFC